MFVLNSKPNESFASQALDLVSGVLFLAIAVMPYLFINPIGNFVFLLLLGRSSDGSAALGIAVLVTLLTVLLPLVAGIILFLISRHRKLVFIGYVAGIPVLIIAWLLYSTCIGF